MLKSEEMRKIIGFILGLVIGLIFLFAPQSVLAESNFTTDYNVTYNVLENALTHVTFDITLTNKTAQYYVSSYGIQVGFKNIENVLSRYSGGETTPRVSKNDDGSSIEIVFNDKVIGLDKKLNFSISFDTKDIAQQSGKIWDINIPGLTKQKEYNSFNVKVVVPKFLGKPSYIKPDIGKFDGTAVNFTKEDLGESGISISYGNEEIYSFNLVYHLKNPNLFPVKTEMALPPNTNYQEVEIAGINPRPLNVTQDKDGNWLAQYLLGPSKQIDIKVKGKAKILLRPKKEELPQDKLKEYLREQPFWQTTDSEIKKIALELKTPDKIYQYVVNKLTYDFSRVESKLPRVGAIGALKNPKSAVCLEFTDLFIALARAAGIPAREINGFAYTQNPKERPLSLVNDILHAWPEYYDFDLQTWVMVDPTWENTTGGVDYFYTLDFDHFAFVIHGSDSNYPIPAGGYKTSKNQTAKDVNVGFAENFEPSSQTLSFSESFSKNYLPGTIIQGNILVKNTGSRISSPQTVTVSSDFLTPPVQKIYFNSIPPFGSILVPVSFKKTSFLTNRAVTLKIAINEEYLLKDIKISPFILNKWTIGGGLLFVIIFIGVAITIYKLRNLLLSRRIGENHLYRESQKS